MTTAAAVEDVAPVIDAEEAAVIHQRLADLVRRHFPDCVMAFTSGSLPYGAAMRGRSDIDVNVVLPNHTRADKPLLRRIDAFIDDYAALHDAFGLCMDRRFPGEYFTIEQAEDAAAGRGVPLVDGLPSLPQQPGDAYWITSEETWYLPWMGALAFSHHLAGDFDRLRLLRRTAWLMIVCLCLPDLPAEGFTADAVLERIQHHDHLHGGFGIPPMYRRFADLERASARRTLRDLTANGILLVANSSYRLAAEQPNAWQWQLAVRHRIGYTARPLLTVTSSLGLAR